MKPSLRARACENGIRTYIRTGVFPRVGAKFQVSATFVKMSENSSISARPIVPISLRVTRISGISGSDTSYFLERKYVVCNFINF